MQPGLLSVALAVRSSRWRSVLWDGCSREQSKAGRTLWRITSGCFIPVTPPTIVKALLVGRSFHLRLGRCDSSQIDARVKHLFVCVCSPSWSSSKVVRTTTPYSSKLHQNALSDGTCSVSTRRKPLSLSGELDRFACAETFIAIKSARNCTSPGAADITHL